MQRLCVPESSFSPSVLPFQALWPLAASNPFQAGGLGSALHDSHSIPAPALPALLPPTTHLSVSQTHPTTSSSFCALLHKAAASHCDWPPLKMLLGCYSWTHLFFPRAVAALMRKGTQNPTKRLHLFCIQRILEQKSMRFKEEKNLNTSDMKNLFQVLIRIIFKFLVTETWRKARLYSRQKELTRNQAPTFSFYRKMKYLVTNITNSFGCVRLNRFVSAAEILS